MIIAFRDEEGYVEIKLTEYPSVDFCDGNAYITDDNGKDYIVRMDRLVLVAKGE